jgi:hypothetical protein
LPWLDLHAGALDADEPSLTAVAELALLLDLIEQSQRSPDLERFAAELRGWLVVQASHAGVRRLMRDGPALALSAPLMLRAALGDDVETALSVEDLAEACARLDLSATPMTYWRRLETVGLTRRLGLAFKPPALCEAAMLTSPLSALRDVEHLYRITHEVFHLTCFGGRELGARPHAAALRKCRAGMAWALANQHMDLIAEFLAAVNCLGGDEILSSEAWAALNKSASRPITDRAEAIGAYHPSVAVLLAAVTPIASATPQPALALAARV